MRVGAQRIAVISRNCGDVSNLRDATPAPDAIRDDESTGTFAKSAEEAAFAAGADGAAGAAAATSAAAGFCAVAAPVESKDRCRASTPRASFTIDEGFLAVASNTADPNVR